MMSGMYIARVDRKSRSGRAKIAAACLIRIVFPQAGLRREKLIEGEQTRRGRTCVTTHSRPLIPQPFVVNGYQDPNADSPSVDAVWIAPWSDPESVHRGKTRKITWAFIVSFAVPLQMLFRRRWGRGPSNCQSAWLWTDTQVDPRPMTAKQTELSGLQFHLPSVTV